MALFDIPLFREAVLLLVVATIIVAQEWKSAIHDAYMKGAIRAEAAEVFQRMPNIRGVDGTVYAFAIVLGVCAGCDIIRVLGAALIAAAVAIPLRGAALGVTRFHGWRHALVAVLGVVLLSYAVIVPSADKALASLFSVAWRLVFSVA